MDLEFWDCLGREETYLTAKFQKTDFLGICSHFRDRKAARINMVLFIKVKFEKKMLILLSGNAPFAAR